MTTSKPHSDDSLESIGCILLEGDALTSQLLAYPEWRVIKVEENTINAIKRTWTFKNFSAAFVFIQHVAELAEQYNHHPRCIVEWGKASVIWWSHDAGGVTASDIQMAALCDHIICDNVVV